MPKSHHSKFKMYLEICTDVRHGIFLVNAFFYAEKHIAHVHLKKDKKTLLNLDNRYIQRISNPKSKPGLVPPAPALLPVLAGGWAGYCVPIGPLCCGHWSPSLLHLQLSNPHSIPTLATDHTFITICHVIKMCIVYRYLSKTIFR